MKVHTWMILLKSDWNSFGIQAHYFYLRSSIYSETGVENLPSAATDRSLGKSSTHLRVWHWLSCSAFHEGCADDYCWRKDTEWKRTLVLVLLETTQDFSSAEKVTLTLDQKNVYKLESYAAAARKDRSLTSSSLCSH